MPTYFKLVINYKVQLYHYRNKYGSDYYGAIRQLNKNMIYN